ncbi:transposase [Patescibacteria group bacterium]|nr:transposase [Patescibacteria group bacterium]
MKNARKKFIEGGIYHVYNRGVNKEAVFFNDSDFNLFIGLIDHYILGNSPNFDKYTKSYKGRVNMLAFCLLNNHFHFLIQQNDKTALTEFMHSLLTSFTMRINNKYKRVGHLFQGIYKARLIESDGDLLNVSRYIHTNEEGKDFLEYSYSSVRVYLGRTWEYLFIDPRIISGISGLSPADDYRAFLLGSNLRAEPAGSARKPTSSESA